MLARWGIPRYLPRKPPNGYLSIWRFLKIAQGIEKIIFLNRQKPIREVKTNDLPNILHHLYLEL